MKYAVKYSAVHNLVHHMPCRNAEPELSPQQVAQLHSCPGLSMHHTSSWRLSATTAAALALSLPVAHSSPLQPRLRCRACRLVSSQLNVGLVPLYALYLGAAAAVEQYSKAAAKEFAHSRISVNCVAPVKL